MLLRAARGAPPSALRTLSTKARDLRGLSKDVEEDERLASRFSSLTNLADARLGSRVLFATDEWFATADNLLKHTPPYFDPEEFCTQGKVMDGWESRRRRLAGHDWCVIRLGVAGYVHGIELDTAWFTGNQAPAAAVLAACIEGGEDEAWLGPPRSTLGVQGSCASPDEIAAAAAAVERAAEWVELIPISPLRSGYVEDEHSVHRFAVPASAAGKRVTHLRLNQHPDGGIARLKAWGVVARDFDTELSAAAVGRIDLLSALNGGRAVGCSNQHYGEPRNLIRPERGMRMDDGWETARNPNRPAVIEKDGSTGLVHMPGVDDWCILRLGALTSGIDELVIDTSHFRGNYPESVRVEVADAPAATSAELLGGGVEWKPLLRRTTVGPDADHSFRIGDGLERAGRASHVRVTILPDGGIMRVRAFGEAVAPMPAEKVEADGAAGACRARARSRPPVDTHRPPRQVPALHALPALPTLRTAPHRPPPPRRQCVRRRARRAGGNLEGGLVHEARATGQVRVARRARGWARARGQGLAPAMRRAGNPLSRGAASRRTY